MDTDAKTNARGIAYGPYPELWLMWPSIVLLFLLFRFLFSRGADWYWFIPGISLPLLTAFAITWRGFLDISTKRVEECARLFGRHVVKTRVMPLTDFKSITFEYRGTDGDEKWWVGLRHKSGRKIWLRACSSELRYAEEFAWQLSCDTGLEMEEVLRRKKFFPSV